MSNVRPDPLHAITINVAPISAVKSGTVGTISVTGNGQSGYAMYYSWTQVSGPTVTIGGSNRNSISFLAPVVTGTYVEPIVFRVTASYAPISANYPGTTSTDVLVAVTP